MNLLTYHEDYNRYDLGLQHPLIGDKPWKTLEFLREKQVLKYFTILTPTPVSEEDLLRVHSKTYVDYVKKLSETGGMLASDTPAPRGIYDIACLAAGGTLLCGQQLCNSYNLAINPLAGFHHASRSHSSGFCFFNDIAVLIESLRFTYKLNRFLIIDLDIHHSNGTQEIYYDDPTVMNISFHQDGRTLYPGTGSIEKIGVDYAAGYTINLPFPPGTNSNSYLHAFDAIIPDLATQFDPQIIIYQSGVDTHHSDPLADMNLTYQTYYSLAKKIHNISQKTCNKLVVLFGGGYNSDSSVKSYYNIICGLLDYTEYYSEPELSTDISEEIKKNVVQLKHYLHDYWIFK